MNFQSLTSTIQLLRLLSAKLRLKRTRLLEKQMLLKKLPLLLNQLLKKRLNNKTVTSKSRLFRGGFLVFETIPIKEDDDTLDHTPQDGEH